MTTIMIMQRMSVAMEYGVILKWLKNEGDKVKKGEPVVEIFGEKNEFELESPADGLLLKTLCDVNDEIPISEPIAIIGEKGEDIPNVAPKKMIDGVAAAPTPTATPVSSPQPTPTTKPTKPTPTLPGGRIKASPRAKKLAKEQGIDLAMIVGSGPEGRIVEKDILGYKSTPFTAGDESRVRKVEPLSPLRRTIARRMTQSSQKPHITMITEIDMSEVVELRKDINKRYEKKLGFRVSFNDIIVKAVADILERFPKFNATLSGNELHMFENINIGVAMATEKGLIVPTVKSANNKSITEIAQETKDMGKRAKTNDLTPEELTGSTFTVSNLGPFQVDLFIPVINPPESAILALGQIKKKPVVIDDQIVIRSTMMASCAVDHRVLDGAPAGQFLLALKEYLESPFFMKV